MTRKLILVILFVLTATCSFARDYNVNSPDGRTGITVNAGTQITWSATYDGKEIFSASRIAMILEGGKILGDNEKIASASVNKLQDIIKPVVANKRSEITNSCNIITLYFKSGFSVEFRAYNDGVAYRFETFFKGDITVTNEISELAFPQGSHAWYPLETSFMSHNERTFIYSSLDTIGAAHLASLPTLFQANGINVLVTESDIVDYPGMWIRGSGSGKISGQWPLYPKSEKLEGDRNLFVTSTEDFIAKTTGTRLFPWRVL
ncbi:MAG: glycoside hydrolase family 97 N-terminal domain-containing protein [Bacteroidales bacterium]|nr:glycoside hydrolase family 97 N-terminal domain-containing protein [Bacteroidales bacterium]